MPLARRSRMFSVHLPSHGTHRRGRMRQFRKTEKSPQCSLASAKLEGKLKHAARERFEQSSRSCPSSSTPTLAEVAANSYLLDI
ncbi:hypothetical protein MHYP_G00324130 [Metynnis hypsauchen]